MVREIVWSVKAVNDLEQILENWNNRNKSNTYSKKLERLFSRALELIAIQPLIALVTDMDGVRIKLVHDYWIFYTERNHNIYVLQILSTYKDPDTHFKEII